MAEHPGEPLSESELRTLEELASLASPPPWIASVEGRDHTSDIFGFTPPPGVAVQLQIAFKPAH